MLAHRCAPELTAFSGVVESSNTRPNFQATGSLTLFLQQSANAQIQNAGAINVPSVLGSLAACAGAMVIGAARFL